MELTHFLIWYLISPESSSQLPLQKKMHNLIRGLALRMQICSKTVITVVFSEKRADSDNRKEDGRVKRAGFWLFSTFVWSDLATQLSHRPTSVHTRSSLV